MVRIAQSQSSMLIDFERLEQSPPDIRDGNVHRPEGCIGFRDETPDILRVRDIGHDADGAPAGFPNLGNNALDILA